MSENYDVVRENEGTNGYAWVVAGAFLYNTL
jgi:hypothetical protein